jgi:hypothetical protein
MDMAEWGEAQTVRQWPVTVLLWSYLGKETVEA